MWSPNRGEQFRESRFVRIAKGYNRTVSDGHWNTLEEYLDAPTVRWYGAKANSYGVAPTIPCNRGGSLVRLLILRFKSYCEKARHGGSCMLWFRQIGVFTKCVSAACAFCALVGTATIWLWVGSSATSKEERVVLGLILIVVLWNKVWQCLRESIMLYIDYGNNKYPDYLEHAPLTYSLLSLAFSVIVTIVLFLSFGLPIFQLVLCFLYIACYSWLFSNLIVLEMVKRALLREIDRI